MRFFYSFIYLLKDGYASRPVYSKNSLDKQEKKHIDY